MLLHHDHTPEPSEVIAQVNMAFLTLGWAIFSLLVFVVITTESAHFPINGCSTDELDIMCLYFQNRRFPEQDYQQILCRQLFDDLLDFNNSKTVPRLMLAEVSDKFSAHNSKVNTSAWNFKTSIQLKPYGMDYQPTGKIKYKNMQEVIETKLAFVKMLFSEMGGPRDDVPHIAIVFLDGTDFSSEEHRQVPLILDQQNEDVRMLVVIRGVIYDQDTVLLNDTLLLTRYFSGFSRHIMTMAVCGQCMQGWTSLRHKYGGESLSCYQAFNSKFQVDWNQAKRNCEFVSGGMLASIETKSELTFLKEHLNRYFNELWIGTNSTRDQSTLVHVYIGLNRNVNNIAKRFQWSFQNRSLVLNNWLSGKPDGGYNNACVVWQFTSKDIPSGESNFSSSQKTFQDGWVDVECLDPVTSFSLCEVSLPLKIDQAKLMNRKPANNDSLVRAVEKGDLFQYQTNIVSASAQIGNVDFLKHIELTLHLVVPVFDCGIDAGNPRYISYMFICDYIDHCRNKRDELSCWPDARAVSASLDGHRFLKQCSGVHCCDGSCLPVQWVNDGEVDCAVCDYSVGNKTNDEAMVLNKFLQRNESCALICNVEMCVRFSQLNDGVVDCTGTDGPIDETIGALKPAESCYNILNQSTWAPLCVYVLDMYGAVLGCRDLSHINNCVGFICPDGYFKCPNTYCIPLHYVLNGQVDCPSGEDEIEDLMVPCTGNFVCWNSKMCIHPDLVCDGHADCPEQDDESGCGLSGNFGFHSIAGTLTLYNYNTSIPLRNVFGDNRVRYIDVSGLDLSLAGLWLFYPLKNGAFIKMSNCKIRHLYDMFDYNAQTIQELDMSYNQLQTLDGIDTDLWALENIRHLNASFNRKLVVVRNLQFSFLETLDLSHTALSEIDEYFLRGFPNLKHFNVSFTFINSFYKNMFPSTLVMQTLYLLGLAINNSHANYFNGLTVIQHLYANSFEMCCPQIRGDNIPYHACHAPDDAISSCFDLVGSNVQRVLLWVFAVLAVLGNITVIVYRFVWNKSNLRTGYGMFVINLGISDLVMGAYLFIIAGADFYYSGSYVLYERAWKESRACQLAGFLATLSSEVSSLFVLLITLDRYLVMKFPFGEVKFSQKSATITVVVSWVVWCVIALVPAAFKFDMYSTSPMCLGLPLTSKRLIGWEYSFAVFIVLNLSVCLLIAYGQRSIFRAMSENRIPGTSTGTNPRRLEDIQVAKQLFLVALSNLFCWFPIGIMGVMSLGLNQISNDVYAWTTVIILPINSAANPLLYTIPSVMVKWDQFKERIRKSRSSGRSTLSPN